MEDLIGILFIVLFFSGLGVIFYYFLKIITSFMTNTDNSKPLRRSMEDKHYNFTDNSIKHKLKNIFIGKSGDISNSNSKQIYI